MGFTGDGDINADGGVFNFPNNESGVLATREWVQQQGYGETPGIDDVLAVGQALTAARSILFGGNTFLSINGKVNYPAGNADSIVGTSSAMVAGTIAVNTTAVTADSKIFLTHNTPIGTLGWLSAGSIVPGVSFVINSTGATDLSTVNWWIIN